MLEPRGQPRTEPAPAPAAAGGEAPGLLDRLDRRLSFLDVETRDIGAIVLLCALLFVPWLGATGLWDPWEGHYAEVARSMLQRRDLVYPYWESAYFFSKPVLVFWMMAAGMAVAGTNGDGTGEVSWLTEWAIRTPFALTAILGAALLALACSRIFGRRVGLVAGIATATSPLYFLLARQAMTDMPFVALLTAAMSCFAIAELAPDERSRRHRDLWLYAFYALCALATLAKGLLGFALPGAVILAYLLLTGDWRLLLRSKLVQGTLIFAAFAVPWFLALSLFDGKDDESKTFAYRFFVHDHFKRLASGVHTTTPGGTFVYFVEQLGFGFFPWVAALPGALATAARARPAADRPRDRGVLLFTLWAVIAFVVFSLSSTKFHHYAFPAIPALAVLAALFVDRLWEEGLVENLVPLVLGLALAALVAHDLWSTPKHLTDLFVYNYERPYPGRELELEAPHRAFSLLGRTFWLSLAPKPVFAGLFSGLGAALVAAFLWRSRRAFVGSFLAGAVLFAVYGSWFHWRMLSPHWSQRDVFHTYFAEREGLEPIAAYYMNWRGETFYSKNAVKQIKDTKLVRDWVARPGREFIVVEQSRLAGLRTTLGEGYRTRILDRSSNKYFLVAVEGEGETPPEPAPIEAPLGSPPE